MIYNASGTDMYNAQYTNQYTTVYKQCTRVHTKLWETLHW